MNGIYLTLTKAIKTVELIYDVLLGRSEFTKIA